MNLIKCIANDDIEKFKIIIKDKRENINYQNECGFTPLMITSMSNYELKNSRYFIETLIKYGTNLNLQETCGRTALMIAIEHLPFDPKMQMEKIKLLINAGADLNKQDDNGWTALMLTIFIHKYKKPEMYVVLKMLLDAGAKQELQTTDGDTVLTIASNHHDIESLHILENHYIKTIMELRQEIDRLKYQPGGEGYLCAKQHFESQIKKLE